MQPRLAVGVLPGVAQRLMMQGSSLQQPGEAVALIPHLAEAAVLAAPVNMYFKYLGSH